MLFQVNYTLTGDQSVARSKELLALFLQRGNSPGEIAHYLRVDGSGGTLISENSDVAEIHDQTMAYHAYMDFEILLIRTAEDSVPELLKHYG